MIKLDIAHIPVIPGVDHCKKVSKMHFQSRKAGCLPQLLGRPAQERAQFHARGHHPAKQKGCAAGTCRVRCRVSRFTSASSRQPRCQVQDSAYPGFTTLKGTRSVHSMLHYEGRTASALAIRATATPAQGQCWLATTVRQPMWPELDKSKKRLTTSIHLIGMDTQHSKRTADTNMDGPGHR